MTRDHLRLLDVHPALQLLKACRLSVVESDDLSIEHEGALGLGRELPERGDDLGELLRLVLSVSRDELHLGRYRVSQDTNAVVLGLECPSFARDLAADAGIHGFERARRKP